MELHFTCSKEEEEELKKTGIVQVEGSTFSIDISNQIKLMKDKKLTTIIDVNGTSTFWNPTLEPDPRVQGHGSRGEKRGLGGFLWSPDYSTKGKYLQDVVKRGIIKAISIAHKQIVTYYDKNAYACEDERLNDLELYLMMFIAQNFEDPHGTSRKLDFMYQFIEILIFLMREDIYYRSRFLSLFNNVPQFQLTEAEEDNIKRWN